MKEIIGFETVIPEEEKNAFLAVCKTLNLETEYPGYTGTEKYAIITSLSDEELTRKFPHTAAALLPYVVLTEEMGKAVLDYKNNEAKYRMRSIRDLAFFELDENLVANQAEEPEQLMRDASVRRELIGAIRKLPGKQGLRIYKRFLLGYSSGEIAAEEGISKQAANKTIAAGLAGLRRLLPESIVKEAL